MNAQLDIEISWEEFDEVHPFYEGVMTICLACEYQDGPEKEDEDRIHEGVFVKRCLHIIIFLHDYSKKFHNQLFELQIVKKFRVFIFVEDKFEAVSVDYFLNLLDMLVVVLVLHFEAQL